MHGHALTHGLSELQIDCAYRTGFSSAVVRPLDRGGEPQCWGCVGFDEAGRQIEVVFVWLDNEAVLVIHANYLAKGFRSELREGRKV